MNKIHFIAIGGSIMHQLAIALKQKGDQVSGSDDDFYEPARSNLKQAGLLPAPGWNPQRITSDISAVILGMHAQKDNPELLKAQELSIPIYSFPEYIYEESKNKTRVVLGGSHGKTTMTSMIMHVLQENKKNFDFLVGASIPGFDRSVKISDAPLIICEGDEYPASAIKKVPKFLFYKPQIAVLSGIAWDHVNVFPTFENYLNTFSQFISGLHKGSILIYNETDEKLQKLVNEKGAHLNVIPYHLPKYKIEKGITEIFMENQSTKLEVFGKHNLQNLQAAAWVCKELGLSAASFLSAIKSFKGASKRLEKVYEKDSAILFRDFAHAPSKVKASMQAVKAQFPERRLTAVLELHTYSSLNPSFLPQYRGALNAADQACVFYSPHALEVKHLPPLDPDQIKKEFGRSDLKVIHQATDLSAFISQQNSNQTNLLMMSSGSFGGLTMNDIIRLWQKKP